MEVPNLKINILSNPSDVSVFWDWLTHRPKGYVACDIETGSNPKGHELQWYLPGFHIRMVQFGDGQGGWAIPFQQWRGLVEAALDWCSLSRTKLVGHNFFTFDRQCFRVEGIDIDPTILEDTQVYAGLGGYAENSRQLKPCAVSELGGWAAAGQSMLHTGMKTNGWTWSDVPFSWRPYPMYGVVDTCLTGLLWEAWQDRREMFGEHHDLEIATAGITNDMSWNGLKVNKDYLLETIDRYAIREAELQAKATAMGWGNPSKDAEVRKVLGEANLLDEMLKTDGGLISVDKHQLGGIDHPLARLVLDFRLTRMSKNNWLQKIYDLSDENGIVHPSIWSMEARTGRMSVSDPPAQQFPANNHDVRRAFIPREPDEVLISADYGQIELRLWASMNKDTKMLAMLNEADRTGEDFFVLLARDLFSEPDFQKKDQRRGPIKNTTYATLYAGGPPTIAKTAGLPLDVVMPIILGLQNRYPSMMDIGQSMVSADREGGACIYTPTGRRFRVKDYREKRKLPNYAVQGHSAEIIKKAAIGCAAAGFRQEAYLPVHDELIFSVKRKHAEEAAHEIAEVMNAQIDPEQYGVAIRAEPTIGEDWSQLK